MQGAVSGRKLARSLRRLGVAGMVLWYAGFNGFTVAHNSKSHFGHILGVLPKLYCYLIGPLQVLDAQGKGPLTRYYVSGGSSPSICQIYLG